jgi:hypothetical protein
MARSATNSDARLIQYELAGRYSVKAADAGKAQLEIVDSPPLVAYAGIS